MTKNGEWNAAQDYSRYLDSSWFVQGRKEEKAFGELSDEDQWKDLMCRSKQEVEEKRGWGVVAAFEGKLFAKGPPMY